MDSKSERIIVSLTSFPGGIPYAAKAVKSILSGSVLPDKVVLYLTLAQFTDCDIPEELTKLAEENPIFEIRNYDNEIRSYRKLIPALQDFPNDIIVTVDDDVWYHPNMLRDLLKLHKKLPQAIIAHRVRKIKLGEPYKKWRKYKWYDFIFRRHIFSYLSMQTGVGGVLYPPHSLDEKMLSQELFTSLAPTTDDVWFWAAAVAKHTYVVPVPAGHNALKGVGKPKEVTLMSLNLEPGNDRNLKALEKILAHFPEIRQIIENE